MRCSVDCGANTTCVEALALVVEQNVVDLLVLAIDGVAVQRLHGHALPVGVLLARDLELLFLGGELLDDLRPP